MKPLVERLTMKIEDGREQPVEIREEIRDGQVVQVKRFAPEASQNAKIKPYKRKKVHRGSSKRNK